MGRPSKKLHPPWAYDMLKRFHKPTHPIPTSKTARRRSRLRRYGLSEADYQKLLTQQNGVCAICGQAPTKAPLSVDHDHATNKVRGLLCINCNMALGQMNDNPEWLRRAADYLDQQTQ